MKTFSVKETAQYLNFSPQTIIRLVKSRHIPAAKWRGILRFGQHRLDKFLAGEYYLPIKSKPGKDDAKNPAWNYPVTILTSQEAADFLKVPKTSLLKDSDLQITSKKIGKHLRFVKELIIDYMTRDISVNNFGGSLEVRWTQWSKLNDCSTLNIQTLDETASSIGISKFKFRDMLNEHLIHHGTKIGKHLRFVKEKVQEDFDDLRGEVEDLQLRIQKLWTEIGEPYHRLTGLQIRLETIRRYCDRPNPKRSL